MGHRPLFSLIIFILGSAVPARGMLPIWYPTVAEGRAADIAIVRDKFLAVDRSFSPSERRQASRLLATLERTAPTLTAAQYELALAEVTALSGNGHTMLFSSGWKARFNSLPVSFLITSEGIYVAEATAPYLDLVGTRVESLDGIDFAGLRRSWSRYKSGEQGFRDSTMYAFIESPELLNAAGLAQSPDRIQLAGRTREGVAIRRNIVAVWPPMPEAKLQNDAGSRLSWLMRGVPEERRPLYLREPQKLFRLVPIPTLQAVYLQFRSNAGTSEGQSAAQFATSVLGSLRNAPPRFIVLDHRLNLGGDLNNTRELMGALGQIVGPRGHLFILTSGETFSAGIASVGYAKQGARGHVTIIGEPVGDALEYWAEGETVLLSSIYNGMLTARERHNYLRACSEADCHLPIKVHPIQVETLSPDVTVPLRYTDFAGGRDAAMDVAMHLVREKLSANASRR